MKKVIALTLSVLIGASACVLSACAGGPSESDSEPVKSTVSEPETVKYGNLSSADVWGAPATEKVLQDKHGIYDDIRTDAKVDVTAARGEYESSHIIITAKEDVPLKYTLTFGSLTAEDGTVFPADNFEVFHEKYVRVYRKYDTTSLPVGWYPDALVPYKNIVEAGENVVDANCNQGLYFRFNVPINQKAGKYTGSVKLTIGSGEMSIPVSLTVEDLTVSETNHCKNNFFVRGLFYKGELEDTQRMKQLYSEALYEYRLCPDELMSGLYHTDAEIQEYVDLAYENMQNPKCSNVSIPYATETVEGYTCIKASVFKKYLKAFAKKSFEKNYNMCAKLVCYLGIIDEPQLDTTGEKGRALKVVVRVYRDTIKSVADELEADSTITSSVKDEVIASMRKIPNTITTHYSEEYADYIDTWCPMYHMYDGELIHNYDDQEEKWWYGCISPRAPYPTYHTEDTLLSARSLGWMQAEYNVVGNLFWGVDVYANYNGVFYEEIEDYYTGDAKRYDQVNGDGYLFYPGKKYGVDGPIGSLRLEAIRDGIEEYELLHAMIEKYNSINSTISAVNPAYSFSSNKVVKSLTSRIYSGTLVSTTSKVFAEARKSLFTLARLATEADVCVLDFSDDNMGTVTYSLLAPSGATVKSGNTALVAKDTVAGYKVYVIETKLVNASNSLNITVENNGKSYSFVQEFGGKVSINSATAYKASEFTNESAGVSPTFTTVNGSSVDGTLTSQVAKIDMPATANGKNQAFRANGKIIEGLGSTTSKFVLRVYYGGEDGVKLVVRAKCSKQSLYNEFITVTLNKGINEIEIPVSAKNWDNLGDVEYLIFYLGEKTGEPARTLYFINSVVYDK